MQRVSLIMLIHTVLCILVNLCLCSSTLLYKTQLLSCCYWKKTHQAFSCPQCGPASLCNEHWWICLLSRSSAGSWGYAPALCVIILLERVCRLHTIHCFIMQSGSWWPAKNPERKKLIQQGSSWAGVCCPPSSCNMFSFLYPFLFIRPLSLYCLSCSCATSIHYSALVPFPVSLHSCPALSPSFLSLVLLPAPL